MFEKSKFKKKFSLLEPYIKDKSLMIKILNNKKINEFYDKTSNEFSKFISNLKLIYNSEEITKIIIDELSNFTENNFDIYSSNLSRYIDCAKKYDNGNIDAIKDFPWNIIKESNYYIESNVLDMCFQKYYKSKILIKGIDILDIYIHLPEIKVKEKLLLIAQNNNLDFLLFVINELSKNNIEIEKINKIFNEEISNKLYHPLTKEKLGEEKFLKLLIEYFSKSSHRDKLIINELLELENYELLGDILYHGKYSSISKCVQDIDLSSNFESLRNKHKLDIIWNNISSSVVEFEYKYLDNLILCISQDKYNEFYEKYKSTLDLIKNLSYDNFSKLTKEEQNKIYKYIKTLNTDQKRLLIEEMKKINLEMQNLYKEEYVKIFTNSKKIIDKAKPKLISDISLKEELEADEYDQKEVRKKMQSKLAQHKIDGKDSVLVYELQNDESFQFLITVMHHKARLDGMNMYGRPAHKLTINNPENFCKDLPGGSEIISTSMIDDTWIGTFVGPAADVMYIFGELETDDIIGICPEDGRFSPKIDETRDLFLSINPVSPKEFMSETKKRYYYNEIAIRRKKLNGKRQKPIAILCYDEINSDSIIHAKYFNVPIIVIKTKTYTYLSNYTSQKGRKSK